MRESNQKVSVSAATSLEKERQISSLERRLAQTQKELDGLTRSLERSEALNNDYQQRLKDFAELWARNKEDKVKRREEEQEEESHDKKRVALLESQLKELAKSSDEMAGKKDSLITAGRREVEILTRKVAETEQSLLAVVQQEYDQILKVIMFSTRQFALIWCSDMFNYWVFLSGFGIL